QLSAASLHASAHSDPPAQGLPVCWAHAPPLHVSVPLQKRLSLHGSVLGGCAHAPLPLHASSVQPLPSSVHGVPPGSKQLPADSLHASAHSGPLAHGSPACWPHAPPLHVSAPLQKTPSSHGAVLFGCAHVPDPSHWSLVQRFPSSAQALPVSAWHEASQQ